MWEEWVILCRHSWFSENESSDFGDPLTFPLFPYQQLKIDFLVKYTFCTDIYGSQIMCSYDFGYPLTFHLLPLAGLHFCFGVKYHKLMDNYAV